MGIALSVPPSAPAVSLRFRMAHCAVGSWETPWFAFSKDYGLAFILNLSGRCLRDDLTPFSMNNPILHGCM
eukprot:3308369-Pleurochrysis_carterae.AAC.1